MHDEPATASNPNAPLPPPIVAFLKRPDGTLQPAPFLLSRTDLADFLRLSDSLTRFPECTIARYRKLGLRSIRIGRRVWFRLDHVLAFLDQHQVRLRVGKHCKPWKAYAE